MITISAMRKCAVGLYPTDNYLGNEYNNYERNSDDGYEMYRNNRNEKNKKTKSSAKMVHSTKCQKTNAVSSAEVV